MITYADLKNKPKEFLAATGLRVEEFEQLLPGFKEKLAARQPSEELTTRGKLRQRRRGAGPKEQLSTDEDKLLFILVYQKTYPIQTMQGLHFGLSQSRTSYWIHFLMPILQEVLADLGHVPERDPEQLLDDPLMNETAADLLTDGTERRQQRSQDAQQQTEQYSGKKKTHTDKNVLLVNLHSKKVIFLSATEKGKKHDKKIMDEQELSFPLGATLLKDTGFQGYEPKGVFTLQPKKTEGPGVEC